MSGLEAERVFSKRTVGDKKSRNGCLSCKKRRRKCDETKPVCGLCTKRGYQCLWKPKSLNWNSSERIKGHKILPLNDKNSSSSEKNPSKSLSPIHSHSHSPSLISPVTSHSESQSSTSTNVLQRRLSKCTHYSPILCERENARFISSNQDLLSFISTSKFEMQNKYIQMFNYEFAERMSCSGDPINKRPWILQLSSNSSHNSLLGNAIAAFAALSSGDIQSGVKLYIEALVTFQDQIKTVSRRKTFIPENEAWLACLILSHFEHQLGNVKKSLQHGNAAIMICNAIRKKHGRPLIESGDVCKRLYLQTRLFRLNTCIISIINGLPQPAPIEYVEDPIELSSIDNAEQLALLLIKTSHAQTVFVKAALDNNTALIQEYHSQLQNYIDKLQRGMTGYYLTQPRVLCEQSHDKLSFRGAFERYYDYCGGLLVLVYLNLCLSITEWPERELIERIFRVFAGLRKDFSFWRFVEHPVFLIAAVFVDDVNDMEWVIDYLKFLYSNCPQDVTAAIRIVKECWSHVTLVRSNNEKINSGAIIGMVAMKWTAHKATLNLDARSITAH